MLGAQSYHLTHGPSKREDKLSELSDSPILLANLLEIDVEDINKKISLDESKPILVINPKEKLIAVNALLKQPCFEIKAITIDALTSSTSS